MKPLLLHAACIGLALSTGGALPALAQMQNNTEPQLTCDNGGYDSDNARHCEMREQTVASIGHWNVDASPNGAINVKGWSRGDTLVRTRVETHAPSQSEAASLATQVVVNAFGGEVRATGPQRGGHDSSWSVSYEIFVPQTTDLTLKSTNGALSISDVRGQLRFEVTNGAVRLKRVAGDVSGTTSNGAITADLAGGTWEGRQLELTTHNGAVTLALPTVYSAHIQAETGNGHIQSDFPITTTLTGELKPHNLDFSVGGGGPLIHISTGNGAVRLKRAE